MTFDAPESRDFSATLSWQTPSCGQSRFSALPSPASPRELKILERDKILLDHAREAINEAWEDGIRVADCVAENAQRLIRLLPDFLPCVEPYVSHAGSLCFDWDENPKFQFSVLLQDRGRVSFAAYFLGEKVNGSSSFSHIDLPESLRFEAQRWRDRILNASEGTS
ncbi:MAG: hypothetical protein JNN30_04160 [Rhodanobacteraceae bacterium]|nr:hypothetical protein [Rhodanobacteraceae bacterium]